MKKLLETIVDWLIQKITRITSWFFCLRNRGLYINKNVDLIKVAKLMAVAPKILDSLIKRGETSSMVTSKIALLNHEHDIKSIAALVSSIADINAILKREDIPYRFYIMDKMNNYFTYKVVDDVTEVYLSKTFT